MTNESPTPPPSDGSDAEIDDPALHADDEMTEPSIDEPAIEESPDEESPDEESIVDEASIDEPALDDSSSESATDAGDASSADHGHQPPPPQPPPPHAGPGGPPYQPPVRRLVRDPYTRLGGVASGISHYTGVDTSIIRILFIITTFTGGFGLLVYLLAWLVIPRAEHWPPSTGPISYRNMTGRDLGVGLAIIGLLVAVSFGASGTTSGLLVPLVLVAGGVWLLVQPPSTPAPVHPGGGSAPPFVTAQGTISAPVPPPKRRRGRWLIAIGIVLALLATLMIPVLIVLGLAFGSLGDTTRFTPTTVEEIPTFFSDDVDRLEIDLSQLDADDFASETMPVTISADLDLGSILVIVPDDISVSVDSTVDLGAISVFGDSVDGFDSTFSSGGPGVGGSAVDLDLQLDIDIGEITVERP